LEVITDSTHDVAFFYLASPFLPPSLSPSKPFLSTTMSDLIDPVQEMQKLDDIEADLADTAMAVVATDEPSLVSNAEAVEHVLEQAIPDAPVEQAHTPPSFEGPVSSAVEDAQAAIDVVQADVVNPILPDVKELPAASPSATPVQIPSDAGLPPRPESNGPILDLPEGLTSNSPSVVSNREAVAGELCVELSNSRQGYSLPVQLGGAKVSGRRRKSMV